MSRRADVNKCKSATGKHELHTNDALCYKNPVKIYRKIRGAELRRKNSQRNSI